jgi:hypothetical protein
MAPHQKGAKRPSSSIAPMSVDKRLKIVAGLASTGGVNKRGLTNVLESLGNQGLLIDAFSIAPSSASHHRCVQDAIEDIPFHATTLHGPLIRSRAPHR